MAKEAVGIQETAENPTNQETPADKESEIKQNSDTESTPKNETESVETKVSKMLSDAKIDTSNIDMNAVCKKYEELANTKDKDGNPLDEAIISQKIKNFAILQKNESFETAEKRFKEMQGRYPTKEEFKQGDAAALAAKDVALLNDEGSKYVDAEITEAMESGDMDKYKTALHNFGKARLDGYDSDKDGLISRKEFRKIEQGSGDEKIKRKDLRSRFDYLDINNDNKLDEKEMTAFYYAMSKCRDGENEATGNDITYAEWMTAQSAVASAGNKSKTDKEKLIFDKFTKWRQVGYENL